MLRVTYYLLVAVLVIGVCQAAVAHQAPLTAYSTIIADGPDPAPPPLPYAVPSSIVADGPDPAPPPLPFAIPTLIR
jgi:hypothetical protein